MMVYVKISSAHPAMVVYIAAHSNYNYSDSRILPLPFRREIARYEFRKRSIEELRETNAFDLNVYAVLAMKRIDRETSYVVQKRLESIADDFISKGLSLIEVDPYGCTALKLAIINNDYLSVRYLLSKGLKIEDKSDVNGDHPICSRSSQSLIKEYLPDFGNVSN